MKKVKNKESGVTLIALVVTIIVLIILASIGITSGKSSIEMSKLTTFTAEMKIMQTEVNSLYDKYKNGSQTEKDEILIYGQPVDELEQTDKVLKQALGITNIDDYRYYDNSQIEYLNIEGVKQEFFVNVKERKIVSYEGIKYRGEMYYTLEQLPNSLYNVTYDYSNTGKPTFDLTYKELDTRSWRIDITNITYDGGYIQKWKVKYQKATEENINENKWETSDSLSFVVKEAGTYNVQIYKDNIISDEQKITILSTSTPVEQPEKGGSTFERTVGTTDIVFLSGTSYKEGEANEPEIDTNTMIPIKYNGTNWVVTTTTDPDWYNYSTEEVTQSDGTITESRKWANVMLTDGGYDQNTPEGTVINDESNLGSMFVWIPRYAYKIVYFGSGSTAEDNKQAYVQDRSDKTNIVGYSDARGIVDIEGKVPSDITEDQITSIPVGDYYRPHPVFEEDTEKGGWGKKTKGIWVGKFETTTTTSSNNTNMILPNKTSQIGADVSIMFSSAQKIGETLNMTLDSHMMKNSEWGATIYLAESQYGRNGTEISVNQCTDFMTGAGRGIGTDIDNPIYNSNYTSSTMDVSQQYKGAIGQLSSSTGNIYGIYDMSGGAWEYVMGFYGTAENTPTLEDTGFSTIPDRKYYDLYINKTSTDSSDIGESLYETKGWNSDRACFVNLYGAMFLRGGFFIDGEEAGGFSFREKYNASGGGSTSFRVCLCVR